MEETHSNGSATEKENEKEEIKHSTKKGLDAGFIRSFSRVHMVVNLWCAPVWGWILTVSGSTSTWGSLWPTLPFMLLHGPYVQLGKTDAGWREIKPVVFS